MLNKFRWLSLPEPESTTKIETWTVYIFAALAVLGAVVYSFFMNRTPVFDEIGLHNAIYMYLKYGKMTYPMHGQFDYMVVHPPYHYLIIALLMKLGLDLFFAAGVPVFLLFTLSTFLIIFGYFSSSIKLGLITGLFCTVFIWGEFYSVRPDLHLTLAWFTGLIALETARRDRWDSKKLLLGSFLSADASSIHYWGAPAVCAVLVYGIWLWRDLPWNKASRKLFALVLGVALFSIPYLLLFVIPNWDDIRIMVAGVQGKKGPIDAFLRHLDSYEAFSQRLVGTWNFRWLVNALVAPILNLKLPAIFAAAVLFSFFRSMRGFAIASTIIPLFVLLYSQGKQVGYTGYFMPEFILWMSVALAVGITVLRWLVQRILSELRSHLIIPAIATFLFLLGIISLPTSLGTQLSLTPRLADLDLARAVGKKIVGDDALVGINSGGVWYTSGVTHWYQPWTDLAYPKYLSVNLLQYLSQFDSFIIDNVWWNNQKKSLPIPSFYAEQKILSLKGFFFNNNRQSYTNGLSYLFLSPQRKRVTGYALRSEQLHKFEENSSGDYIFASVICPTQINVIPEMEYYNSISLDQPGATNPHLNTFLIKRDTYRLKNSAIISGCQPRDEVAGFLTLVDKDELLKKLDQEDKPIRFYRTLNEAEIAKVRQVAPNPTFLAETTTERWKNWQTVNPEAKIWLSKKTNALKLVTNQSADAFQLRSPLIQVKKNSTYWVQFSFMVEAGGFSLHIADKNSQAIASSSECRPTQEFTERKFIFETTNQEAAYIIVSNCNPKGKESKLALKNLEIRQVELANPE